MAELLKIVYDSDEEVTVLLVDMQIEVMFGQAGSWKFECQSMFWLL